MGLIPASDRKLDEAWKLMKPFPFSYHDDFRTPGISPFIASSRKQIRQRSYCRRYPCFRPHFQQRRTTRVENFGCFSALAVTEVFAIRNVLS